jgi:hypothetical protein
MAQRIFMHVELKNNGFMLRLLLFINAVLICAILLMHTRIEHSMNADDSHKNIKTFSVDAVNSITIKLM